MTKLIDKIGEMIELNCEGCTFAVVPATSGINVVIGAGTTVCLTHQEAESLKNWLVELFLDE